jgi:lipopolysaccharide/colanic/teichoic acid biosynthesis glycosyltransferase
MARLGSVAGGAGELDRSPHSLASTILTGERDKRRYLRIKRVMDVVLSCLLLMLLSPLLLLAAIFIKLDSPGPVIFRQTRIGKQGKPFTFLKFRSMRQDADPRAHQEHMRTLIRGTDTSGPGSDDSRSSGDRAGKLCRDGRVTRVGRFIRKTSVDELPQLFNVLRGEMSLAGPRPPLPYEVGIYEDWHMRRLEVMPGITSLWAVRGRADIPFDDQVRMDIEYIENRSLWLDVRILMQTPWAVISGKGAG